jgi:hypothetical protein
MKYLAIVFSIVLLTGCGTIKKYWPRAHDPILVDQWVTVSIAVSDVDCTAEKTGWANVVLPAQRLWMLSDFREDPQSENLHGLWEHAKKMSKGGSKMFCEIGKNTAKQRLQAAKSAWEGR